ncbi:hypothetical protein [uncultured Shewanella sp.]|uniref:hypothetical protein n=1 Tax=uncultured Shewanella sp. TaxID=173975 RepID=UPI0026398185|nr:hypothetical protein [uncultured Shewanella sp.]
MKKLTFSLIAPIFVFSSYCFAYDSTATITITNNSDSTITFNEESSVDSIGTFKNSDDQQEDYVAYEFSKSIFDQTTGAETVGCNTSEIAPNSSCYMEIYTNKDKNQKKTQIDLVFGDDDENSWEFQLDINSKHCGRDANTTKRYRWRLHNETDNVNIPDHHGDWADKCQGGAPNADFTVTLN